MTNIPYRWTTICSCKDCGEEFSYSATVTPPAGFQEPVMPTGWTFIDGKLRCLRCSCIFLDGTVIDAKKRLAFMPAVHPDRFMLEKSLKEVESLLSETLTHVEQADKDLRAAELELEKQRNPIS